MGSTRSFCVRERALSDEEFRRGLLEEATNSFLGGELDVGKILLRDYINATISFQALADSMKKSPKSLMRMLSVEGNPTAANLFGMLSKLQEAEGIQIETHII